MRLTPIGSDFEAIIAAVVFFLLGGFISFALCFCFTNAFLCYKRRVIKRHHRYSVDDFDYTVLSADNNSMVSPNEVVVVDAGRLQKTHTYVQPSSQSNKKRLSDASSLSTSSTNET